MKTYGEYRPTEHDAAGLGLPDRKDWLVAPVSRNRDSSPTEESNFETAVARMGGESDDVEVHRFGHWGNGWFEIALVRPGSEAAEKAAEIEKSLQNYSILDEHDVSAREHEEYWNSWESWGAREYAQNLVKKFGLDETSEDLLLDADKEKLLTFFESLIPSGEYHQDGAPMVRYAIEEVTEDQVEEFITGLKAPSP